MGQKANPKRTQGNEALAYGRYIKSSPRKLNLLAQMIRGKKAGRALTDLQFSKRRVAQEVRKVLQSAIANAENNHGLDVDRLIVSKATVGRSLTMRRFHARGRGRASPVDKMFANITIVVAEAEEKVKKQKKESQGSGKSKQPKEAAKKPKQPKKKKEQE
ncbi:MAG: 50S ribosomal protein L22 [Alphaproteobacteria bacterium]|nr:50S ribosomal protein L22 [Alphaproteobacteria bacterium]